ncbi:stromal membrane-associated protein 1-like isoform X2 [Ischnura elegans]|uniref:stromal membrane-associated protein 1-like isoform X2 n=1 Tax=Ischnura elegans TaxID=197161 RepID=UPI001ED87EBB|nr:stromal membrane-associated protein 1-like isoform X2 [Ischnura elegans]
MTSKAERDKQKAIQEKCQTLLNQMLRDEDNKYCVDCDAKGPRWASWNLGVFLCIRCAGIHRNLGVHISKVKSVNLDTWTPEQVVCLQQMGNSRARAVYEANLPDGFRRPQSDSSLEAFVRAKYEARKYVAREWVPPQPPAKVDWDKELEAEAKKKREAKRRGGSQSSQLSSSPSSSTGNVTQSPSSSPAANTSATERRPRQSALTPIPKPEKGSTAGAKAGRVSETKEKPSSATEDLLGLDAPVPITAASSGTLGSGGDDIFSSFLSGPPPPPAVVSTGASKADASANEAGKRTAEEESFFNQALAGGSQGEKKQLTKDSIMALYSQGSGVASATPAPAFGSMQGMMMDVGGSGRGMFPQQQPSQQVFQGSGIPVAGYGMMPNGMMGVQSAMPVQTVGRGVSGLPGGSPGMIQNGMFVGVPTLAQGQQHPMGAAQPAVGIPSNPFLAICPPFIPPGSNFAGSASPALGQLSQQMAQMSLAGGGMAPGMTMGMPGMNPSAMTFTSQVAPSGQTLSTNLWQ